MAPSAEEIRTIFESPLPEPLTCAEMLDGVEIFLVWTANKKSRLI